jgi:anti-anti-sigma factor
MSTAQAQQWHGSSFSIERKRGKAPGTVILSLMGPFTARDMYGKLTPVELKDLLRTPAVPGEEAVTFQILDLTSVSYMDSFGLGMLVTHFASCKNHGLKMVAAGANARVLELMRLTKMDTIIPLAESVEAAEIS